MTRSSSAVAMSLFGVRNPGVDGPQGDAVPFFHEGRYHLFYLEAPAGKLDQPERGRTPWRHVVSDNLLEWEDLGIALPLGEGDAPDTDGIWTGSIIAVGGVLHVFYTGGRRVAATPQTICHATSMDGVTFTKDPRNPILLPQETWFERQDWRDPFVFWNEEHQQYWMLISGRVRQGPPGRRGVIVLSTSPDLVDWATSAEPLYAPGNTYCMECPEVFRLGGKWRMIFSRFTENAATVYRDAEALTGPWRTPEAPALDGGRWYAAKSLEDARGRRIAFGWTHDRRGFDNAGEWLWGGDMCLPREIYARPDDRLAVRPPDEIAAAIALGAPLAIRGAVGAWRAGERGVHAVEAAGATASADLVLPAISGELHLLAVKIRFRDLRGSVGLALWSDADLTSGLGLIYEPAHGRVTLKEWAAGAEKDREPPPLVEAWLPIGSAGSLDAEVFLRGNLVEAFLNREVAVTHRFYATKPFTAALLVEDGYADFSAALGSLRPAEKEPGSQSARDIAIVTAGASIATGDSPLGKLPPRGD